MFHTRLQFTRCMVLALVALLATFEAVAGNFNELLRRVPESANTLILIDVERMLMSPIAMKEKWREKANTADRETLHFPINSVRYMLASKLNLVADFENLWDVALIESIDPVSLPYLSKMEGGYLDSVEGQEVAYSRRNAFFVSLKPKIVGVCFPANRQDLGAYLRSLKRYEKPQVSEYLENAVIQAHGRDQIVAALDLGDLFTSRQVRELLHSAECLAGKEIDLDAITRVITSIKGVTFSVQATERLYGKMRVDFGESPGPLKEVAKALLFEAIENNGMMLDNEIKNWRILFEPKAVTLEGRLSTKGLRMLTDLVPFPVETVALKEASPSPGETVAASVESASKADSKAITSRKYFQHLSLLIDTIRTDAPKAGSPKLARRMVDSAALEIDRLPVLNVDEDLIAYGAGVSSTFRNMRNLSNYASLDANFRQASLSVNQGGYGGFYGGGTNLSVSTSAMRKQETAVLKSNQMAVFTLLEEKTAEIRKRMTLKYQVEF